MLKIECTGSIQAEHEMFCFVAACCQTGSVDNEEGVHHGESGALVTVNEGMVLRKAFPQRGGLLDQIGIIAGLWSEKGGFEQSTIPHPGSSSITLYLVVMDCQRFNNGQIVRHSANFL
jgi:hypothetical protein